MEKPTENYGVTETDGYGLDDARAVLDRHLGSWVPVAWRVAVFYGVWITLAYVAMTNASSVEGAQIAAIGFWFGWLFLAATIALGVAVTVGGFVDRYKLSRNERKY